MARRCGIYCGRAIERAACAVPCWPAARVQSTDSVPPALSRHTGLWWWCAGAARGPRDGDGTPEAERAPWPARVSRVSPVTCELVIATVGSRVSVSPRVCPLALGAFSSLWSCPAPGRPLSDVRASLSVSSRVSSVEKEALAKTPQSTAQFAPAAWAAARGTERRLRSRVARPIAGGRTASRLAGRRAGRRAAGCSSRSGGTCT